MKKNNVGMGKGIQADEGKKESGGLLMPLKVRFIQLIGIFLFVPILQGCTLEGACESYNNYGAGNLYYCEDVSASNELKMKTGSDICFSGDGNTFHENTSCSELGYDYPSFLGGSGDFYYNAVQDPSPYGAYASSGVGAKGTACNSNTVWTGAPNDIQVSTQCQTACVYADGGNEQGRAASCGIIAKLGATSSCSICP